MSRPHGNPGNTNTNTNTDYDLTAAIAGAAAGAMASGGDGGDAASTASQGQGQGQDQGQGQGQGQDQSLENTNNITIDFGDDCLRPNQDDYDVVDLDADHVGVSDQGIYIPDAIYQVTTNGNNFNIDQVNNLSDNDALYTPSVSYGGLSGSGNSNGGEWSTSEGCGCCSYEESFGASGMPNAFTGFEMNATSTGGTATAGGGAGNGTFDFDDGRLTDVGSASADSAVNQEAFTQSISMGANTQFNSIDQTVIGHDMGA
jgi:hypothetical protein